MAKDGGAGSEPYICPRPSPELSLGGPHGLAISGGDLRELCGSCETSTVGAITASCCEQSRCAESAPGLYSSISKGVSRGGSYAEIFRSEPGEADVEAAGEADVEAAAKTTKGKQTHKKCIHGKRKARRR